MPTDAIFSYVLLAGLIAVFYFMLIRPENKKKKAMAQMRAALSAGDEVTTIGGIHGVVCAIKDEVVVIETGADRVRVELAKWAISTVSKPSEKEDAK